MHSCAAEQFTDVQRALLMSSFFPGYIATQIPGSYAIQRYGAKLVMAIDMVVTACVCFLMPSAIRIGGPRMLAPLLTLAGLSQGPLIPALQVLKKDWLPNGPSRAMILRLMSVPPICSEVLANTIYPLICIRFGWHLFPYVHGVFTLGTMALWQLFLQNKPPPARSHCFETSVATGSSSSGGGSAAAMGAAPAPPAQAPPKTVEWRIFKLPCVLSCIWAKFGSGVLSYSLDMWAPLYFVENLGCRPEQVAAFLLWKTPLYTSIDFLSGAIEGMLVAKEVPLVTIRKAATTIASILQSLCALAFGLTRSPIRAAIFYNCVTGLYGIHHSGFSSNLIEVGGEDTAMMNAIANNLGAFRPLSIRLLALALGVVVMQLSCLESLTASTLSAVSQRICLASSPQSRALHCERARERTEAPAR